jgi:CLASP N terminal/CAP-Gly domain
MTAMTDLEKLVLDSAEHPSFRRIFHGYQIDLGKALGGAMTDLRSEIVKQASHTLTTLVRELGDSLQKFSRVSIGSIFEASDSRNGIIRTYATKCGHLLLQNVHSKASLLLLLDNMRNTRSKQMQETCMDFLRTCLAFWPISEKYSRHADVLEDAILWGVKGATSGVRALAAKCFWLFAGHFADRREAIMENLDSRTRRILEKGKTRDEEEKEYRSASKIAAIVRGHIQRKRFRKSLSFGKTLATGQRVKIIGTSKTGTTRYFGGLPGKQGTFVGVETDQFDAKHGNGSVNGVSYFTCEPGHAIFCRIPALLPIDEEEEAALAAAAAAAEDDELALTPRKGAGNDNGGGDDYDDDDDPDLPPVPQVPSFSSDTDSSSLSKGLSQSDMRGLPGRARALTDSPLFPDVADAAPKLQASAAQQRLESGDGKDASDRSAMLKGKHARQLSMPRANELNTIKQEHKFHLGLLSEQFQKEMDLLESQADNPNYVTDMVELLGDISKRAEFIRVRFADFKRRKENQAVAEDPFLTSLDNF